MRQSSTSVVSRCRRRQMRLLSVLVVAVCCVASWKVCTRSMTSGLWCPSSAPRRKGLVSLRNRLVADSSWRSRRSNRLRAHWRRKSSRKSHSIGARSTGFYHALSATLKPFRFEFDLRCVISNSSFYQILGLSRHVARSSRRCRTIVWHSDRRFGTRRNIAGKETEFGVGDRLWWDRRKDQYRRIQACFAVITKSFDLLLFRRFASTHR